MSLLLAASFLGCAKSEKLNEEEIEYVKLSVALGKVRAFANDSAHHHRLRDSVLTAYQTTLNAYTAKTESLTETPDRTATIFRAIADSLGIRKLLSAEKGTDDHAVIKRSNGVVLIDH